MDGRSPALSTADAGSSGRLTVHVLATTVEGTTCALQSAKRLTAGLHTRVVLLVHSRKSLSASSHATSAERASLVDRYGSVAAAVGVDVTVLFCVCQRVDDVVHQMLGRSSLVIVGGRRRVWWPSREQRLVQRLTAGGYPVVFAQVGVELACARVPVMAS
jgi:hypothetical protein